MPSMYALYFYAIPVCKPTFVVMAGPGHERPGTKYDKAAIHGLPLYKMVTR